MRSGYLQSPICRGPKRARGALAIGLAYRFFWAMLDRLSLTLALLLLTASVAPAAPRRDDNLVEDRNQYAHCLALTRSNAEEAELTAQSWRKSGGGAPALHCEALALVALHRYAEAARLLDQAALAAHTGDLRMALSDQAGNAWLLAGDAAKAEASIDSALALGPHDEDILFDRARARAGRKNWQGADADLTALLALDPERADAFVLRASARHAEGRKAEAGADIAQALAIYPDYPDALVERGSMRFEAGDLSGARADWLTVVRSAPSTEAGEAARVRLE